MAIIDTIRSKLRDIDAGAFQILCDSILYSMGYRNIVSLGTQAGTRKTTKGTPDTYFIDENGKYIFVEYTTQQTTLKKKIQEDLDKCLSFEMTKIKTDDISTIIYCHNSSNLSPADDKELKQICSEKGILLKIFGIDELANFLYKEKFIARDVLDIQFGNGQIFNIEGFIKKYNSQKLAAPLDGEMMFREQELKRIDESLAENDVVVLVGQAGTGKTRLAVEYLNDYSLRYKMTKVLCIKQNEMPLFDELKLFIDSKGDYLLFVDDANNMPQIKYVLEYLNESDISVKVLVTVRQYASQAVVEKVTGYTNKIGVVNVGLLSDDNIKEIAKANLGIENEDYLIRLASLAKGNARLAYMAGKRAVEDNSILALHTLQDLYRSYYSAVFDNGKLNENKDLLLASGIAAFYRTLDLNNFDYLQPIFSIIGISTDTFVDSLKQLEISEIVTIYENRVMKFSDECFGDYILFYVLYEKKLIELSDMIRVSFSDYTHRIISAINVLLNNFFSEEIEKYVDSSIDLIWNELKASDSNLFWEFLKSFYLLNPIKTLLVLKEKIESYTAEQIELKDMDQSGSDMINDDILTVLCGLVKTKKYRKAVNLFFQYFIKKPSLLKQFVSAIEQYFFMSYYSYERGFCVEKEFLKTIKKHSDNWSNDNIVFLFFKVLEHMMKIKYNVIHSSTERSFTMCNICLNAHPDVLEYRSIVWLYLNELSNISVYYERVSAFLRSYILGMRDTDAPIIENELPQLLQLINKCCDSNRVIDCLTVECLVEFAKQHEFIVKIDITSFDAFLSSTKLNIYHFLSKDNKELFLKQLSNADRECIYSVIDVCFELEACRDKDIYLNLYEFEMGFSLFFMSVLEHVSFYYDVVKYYLKSNCPSRVRAKDILDLLFTRHIPVEIWNLIDTIEFSEKNEWQYYYFECLPERYVNETELERLNLFLKSRTDVDVKTGHCFSIDKLKKYNAISQDAFINCCRIIYQKKEYNKFLLFCYFDLLFICGHTSSVELFNLFANDNSLLEDIYLAVIPQSKFADLNGECFKGLILRNFDFAKRYITSLLNLKIRNNHELYNRIICVYELDNSNEVFISIIHTIIECIPMHFYELQELFSAIIDRKKYKEKSDRLIRYLIQSKNTDRVIMECLFDSITKLCNEDRIEYLLLFINENPSIDDFRNVPLTSLSDSWSGSRIPLIEKKISFLHELLDVISDYDYLEHEAYISEKIRIMEEWKITTQLLEILRGY